MALIVFLCTNPAAFIAPPIAGDMFCKMTSNAGISSQVILFAQSHCFCANSGPHFSWDERHLNPIPLHIIPLAYRIQLQPYGFSRPLLIARTPHNWLHALAVVLVGFRRSPLRLRLLAKELHPLGCHTIVGVVNRGNTRA